MLFAAKKILSSLILPPGLFIVLALLSGLWMIRRRIKYGYLSIILAGVIYVLSIAPVADSLMGPLEKSWQSPRKVSGDVIVVLGGGVISGVADFSGRGFPSGTSLSRLVTALRLHRTTGLPLIISGGKVLAGRDAEAPVAQRILLDLGMSAEQIVVEDQSRDTRENARFVKEICLRRNWRKPILVTSALHMERASMTFREAGMEVNPYPADFLTAPEPSTFGWPDFLPSASSLARTTCALHEYLGILFYKLFY